MSAKSKRGRPVKDVNKVSINDLVVEFIATKENGYNANICYLKVVDVECKTKMKSIIGLQDDDIRMPYWKTDKQEMILKVKNSKIDKRRQLKGKIPLRYNPTKIFVSESISYLYHANYKFSETRVIT